MRRMGLVILAWCFATGLRAHADEWTKTFNITGKPDLRVDTSDANIRVNTWDQNTIEVKVIATRDKIGAGIRVEDHQNGDSVELNVRLAHHSHMPLRIEVGNHRVDIDIHMPREGRLDLRTGDGKIEVSSFKGEMDLRSGDGSQMIDAVDGKLRATTSDGHIRANGRFDELELKTGDGPVEVRASAGSSLNTGWRLETGDGNVRLEIPGTLAADVDLHTGDGHIDLDIPVTTEGKLRENEVHGKINGGGSLVTIRTGDGSIHLSKS